jgi:allophanate hydrolase subunit 2
VLPIGTHTVDAPSSESATPGVDQRPLRMLLGPRTDWFVSSAIPILTSASWTVATSSNRVGIRLTGPMLERSNSAELPSEPTLPGAIQVPLDGQPIILGPDAPVTGGYPVIAVLATDQLSRLAQVRPGDEIRLAEYAI